MTGCVSALALHSQALKQQIYDCSLNSPFRDFSMNAINKAPSGSRIETYRTLSEWWHVSFWMVTIQYHGRVVEFLDVETDPTTERSIQSGQRHPQARDTH